MGASGSRQANGAQQIATARDQFVLIVTAPLGVGKEELMGTFISENVKRVAYVAKIGAVRATKPGLLYFYESAANITAERTQPDSYSTILQAIQAALHDGKSVVVDVDEAGARALRDFNVPGCYVFVLPESMDSLRKNIAEALKGDPQEVIQRTVEAAEQEILAVEDSDLYDYGVQNDSESGALEQIATLADTHGRVAPAVLAIPSDQAYPESPAVTSHASDPISLDREVSTLQPRSAQRSTSNLRRGASGSAAADSPTLKHGNRAASLEDRADSARHHDPGEIAVPSGMERWHGAVAVVTGASSGIGWAVCEALVAAGMHVVGAARRKDRLQALQSHVLQAGAGGRTFLPVMCDVTREHEVRTLMSIAVKTFDGKPVSVLVHAAGARPAAGGQLLDGSAAAWVEAMSTNVLATGMCCREACTSMKRAGEWGHIVLMGGDAGPAEGRDTFFNAAKCAVKSIAEGLRLEARAAGVPLRVSLVSCSRVDTETTRARAGDGAEEAELSPVDVANAVLAALAQPAHVDVSEVTLRSVEQIA